LSSRPAPAGLSSPAARLAEGQCQVAQPARGRRPRPRSQAQTAAAPCEPTSTRPDVGAMQIGPEREEQRQPPRRPPRRFAPLSLQPPAVRLPGEREREWIREPVRPGEPVQAGGSGRPQRARGRIRSVAAPEQPAGLAPERPRDHDACQPDHAVQAGQPVGQREEHFGQPLVGHELAAQARVRPQVAGWHGACGEDVPADGQVPAQIAVGVQHARPVDCGRQQQPDEHQVGQRWQQPADPARAACGVGDREAGHARYCTTERRPRGAHCCIRRSVL
jgi:hypothetical protein